MTAHANGKVTKLLNRLATTEQFIRWLPKPAKGEPTWTKEYEPLTPRLVQDHLDGNCVLGAYPYEDDGGTARTGVIDVDLHTDEPTPEQIAVVEAYAFRKFRELEALGIVCLLVRGHDLGSYHIIFDTTPITAERLGRWLEKFVADAVDASIHVDAFPSVSGRGNAVRLPGRHHKKTDQWSASWSGSEWEPWPAALDRLLSLTPNPAKLFPDPGIPKAEPKTVNTDGTRPGDIFNRSVPVEKVLQDHGWHSPRQDGERLMLTRPGKDSGNSAAIKDGTAWIYTESVKGLPSSEKSGKPYDSFALVAHLDYDGDFSKAAKELAKAGYVKPPDPSVIFKGDTSPVEPVAPPAPEWPAPMAQEAFHGLAGRFVAAVGPASEADPVALLVQFLLGVGNAIGRTAHGTAEADKHHTNEFAVLVGKSAKGRKGTSWGQVRRVLERAEQTWVESRVMGGLSSGEGVIWAVRDPIQKQECIREKGKAPRYETVEADPGEPDKRLFIVEPEFANVLKQTERQGNTLSAILRQLWETGSLRSLTKNNPARATDAHGSIIGHITADELKRYLTATESANGFGNRFMWFLVKRSKMLPEGGRPDLTALATIEAELAEVLTFAKEVATITRDDDARALWHEVYPILSGDRHGLAGSLTGRAEAHVLRLSIVYAVLDRSPVVRPDHLTAALAVWQYADDSVLCLFGDSTGNPMADDILAVLRNVPSGMTRTEIRELVGKNTPAERIAQALGVLLGLKLAKPEKRETGGRPTEFWTAAPRGGATK